MFGGKVSDDVIDAIAFIEMHRQETAKESGNAAACAQALPKLQELLDQLGAATGEPPDVLAANVTAVKNDIARITRLASGGGNKHQRQGQRKHAPRQQGHGQGQSHGNGSSGQAPHADHAPNPGQARRRGRNKRRGGGGPRGAQ